VRKKVKKLAVMIAAGLFFGQALSFGQGPPPATVVVGEVAFEEVASTTAVTGVIYYERVSALSSEVNGLVEEVKVRQGDQVAEDTPLVRLNTEILEREIALTRTRIEQIGLRIDNTGKNYQRLQRLYAGAGVSEKDFDDAVFAYQDAKMEKQAAEDSLAKLLIQQRRSLITAPFPGIVLSKQVDSGAWVQPGRELLSLGSSDDLFVRAPIAETMLQYMQIGEKVEVVINAFDQRIDGTIFGIDPVADLKTKNIFLKVKIAPMELVAENMSATVYVPSSGKRRLAVFSRAALVKFQGNDFVYTVKDGKASLLPVNIVTFLGSKVAVDTPSIVPGLPVVIEGNERLRPDQAVQVVGDN
jgi:membrane fusion protein, multidrug efflux system